MSVAGSPFLEIPPSDWVTANRSAFAIRDRYPVNEGHTLVVSRRLISTWWEATAEERTDLLALVDEVKEALDGELSPEGYNVGFNAGEAAGQTVPHLHIHVIPRYAGDVVDPRGGVRHVIPAKGNYLLASADRQVSAGEDADAPGIPGEADVTAAPIPFQLFDGQDHPLHQHLVRCLRDARYDRVDLVVSFVMLSGLDLVDDALQDAIDRGAHVRILTTDYLCLTDARALARLLDVAEAPDGELQIRVFSDASTSFHPKAYLFWAHDDSAGAAFVGSSNLSRAGILSGIEWNLGVDRVSPMREQFEALWSDARSLELTREWVRSYQSRQPPPGAAIAGEVADEPTIQPVEPRPIQREALNALEQTRLAGFGAGLVVMATGLGKTWLAAFDTARPQFRRVLFIAHREEILRQSRDVFRRVQPDGELGLYFGGEKQPDARIVFASIQTLTRNLERFAPDAFDYVVIDEFHHAAATSYRRVIDYFTPKFLLGLTATPERMDGADLLALCGENLVYECGLTEGIEREELVPFSYWGVPDPVDFEPIPWRNGRFDPAALERAVETEERAGAALEEWSKRRGARTLAFCASTSHADFMANYFNNAGIRSAAVHSAPTSAQRHEALDALRRGELDVIFAVDLFNEGLDMPEMDTVLMLRPTESPVVFLQQLGRGLRTMEGKARLLVVDFIGNHRSFLLKPRTLLNLGTRQVPSTNKVLAAMREGNFSLPAGCSVEYSLDVVDMMRELAKVSRRSGLEEYCRTYFEEEGVRPSAAQAFRAGYNPAATRASHGSWFALLDGLDMLSPGEVATFTAAGEVLGGLEKEPVTKSYKLVTLRALLHDGAIRSGAPLEQVAATARQLVLADPRLLRDATNEEFPDLATASAERWAAYWRKWPIAAWTGELRGSPGAGSASSATALYQGSQSKKSSE